MQVDIQELGAVNRMAHEGAERAASHLSAMTDIETFVDVTRTHVQTTPERDDSTASARADSTAQQSGLATPDENRRVGVIIELDGGLRGRTAFTFSRESVERVREILAPGADDMDESLVRELGNVMAGGFVDGWADYLGTTIDISPPTYVDGTPELDADGPTFVFASEVGAVDESVSFSVQLSPEPDCMTDILSGDGETVSVENLSNFDEMTRIGAISVAENLSMMTGIDTTVDITNVNFVPVEEVSEGMGETMCVGVVFELESAPGGFVLILFDESSAHDVARAMVPSDNGEEFDEMEKNAIREMGNIMASSFIDGWANALESTIDISTPKFAHDMGGAIVDPLVAHLGQSQQFAFVSDATIRADDETFDCTLYALPDESDLRDALSSLDTDVSAERVTKAGRL
ncbi:chemotaxis protein CheC [Haladaptatus cibarius]|uniref:chemotaxis protein CheC n=1 Tax=Haladaptatus cibarius TaxID=453847 RepID=UPI0006788A55|nr:chemotaxis protein CheC [Haladaptatus cibarius]